MQDALTPALLDPLIAGTLFHGKVQCFASIPSTNTAAMKDAIDGVPAGNVYIADEQTAGRGRGGHDWHSPPGSGLYVSVVLRPKLGSQEALWLSLAAGLAAHTAILATCQTAPDLRWPNDIMYGRRKVGGILTEMASEAGSGHVRYAVIGIGINVAQESFPPGLSESATSLLLETGRVWPRLPLSGALLKSLHWELNALETDTAKAGESLRKRFAAHSSYVEKARVHVEEDGGYDGTTCGLTEKGFLRVEKDGVVRTVMNGGVRKL
jgi:BirA family biotin operon repressor/biotin-[acetyl-CoA-carboxylase] ligase